MTLTISKLDAAKRQLETVIRLYFSFDDPVSIHTLTAAAYNILLDITEKRGAEPMLVKDRMLDYLNPEYRERFARKANEAENFFKHADRDHESTLDFNPVMSEFLLIDACSQYAKLTGEDPRLFVLYRVWFMANNPKMFIFPEEFGRILKATAASIVAMGRARYFSTMLPAIMNILASELQLASDELDEVTLTYMQQSGLALTVHAPDRVPFLADDKECWFVKPCV